MRINRKWIALLIGSAMAISMMTGCSSSSKSDSAATSDATASESKFVGLWQYYDYKNGYELKADHTFSYYHSSSSSNDEGGTWKVNGDAVTLTYNDKDLAAIDLTMDAGGDLVDPENDALYKTESFDFLKSSSSSAVEESTEDLSDESQFNGDDDTEAYDSDWNLWSYVGIWQLSGSNAGFYLTSTGHWYGEKEDGTWSSGTWTGNDTGLTRTSSSGDKVFTLTDGTLVSDDGDVFVNSDGSFLIDTTASNFLDKQWQYADSKVAFYIRGLHQYIYLNDGVVDADLSGYWVMNSDGTISLHAYGYDENSYKTFTYNENGTLTDADGKALNSVEISESVQ